MSLHLQKAPEAIQLYSYFRSSAAYRVRIALNIKGIKYDCKYVNLRDNEQETNEYKSINPQGLLPLLKTGEDSISQSLAIIDYLEGIYPTPSLFPKDPLAKARVLEIAHIISMDIHPLNNLRVLKYLTNELKIDEYERLQWYKHWMDLGMNTIETKLKTFGTSGRFCYADTATLADICLIPQVYNALRYECNMTEYVNIMNIYHHCLKIPEFSNACPESQEDAV